MAGITSIDASRHASIKPLDARGASTSGHHVVPSGSDNVDLNPGCHRAHALELSPSDRDAMHRPEENRSAFALTPPLITARNISPPGNARALGAAAPPPINKRQQSGPGPMIIETGTSLQGVEPANDIVVAPSTAIVLAAERPAVAAEPVSAKKNRFIALSMHKNAVKAIRTVAQALVLATLLVSVALLAGAAFEILLAAAVVGAICGALIGWYANELSVAIMRPLLRDIETQSIGRQVARGSKISVTSAVLHTTLGRLSGQGVATAATFGACAVPLAVLCRRPAAGGRAAVAAGAAVGTVELLALGTGNNAMRCGAGLGGFIGGLVVNVQNLSPRVGESAAKGALAGGLLGRTVDNYIVWLVCNTLLHRSNLFGKAAAKLISGVSVFRLATDHHHPGVGEWTGAAVGGTGAGVYSAVDINTNGGATKTLLALKQDTVKHAQALTECAMQTGHALGVARAGVSWSKLLRAAHNFSGRSAPITTSFRYSSRTAPAAAHLKPLLPPLIG